jgi:hypothetical protein
MFIMVFNLNFKIQKISNQMKLFNSILSSLLIFFVTITLFAKAYGQEVIRINIDEPGKAQLKVDIASIVPLETAPNCLMGDISKIICYDHRIYLLNNNRFMEPTLFLFNDAGKFIRKTIRGKGPGEVNEPFAFAIDKQEKMVYLHDQSANATPVFDLDLKYVKSIDHEYRMISDFYHIGSDTFLVYHHQNNLDYKSGKQYFTHTLYSGGFTQEKQLGILSYNRITMMNTVCVTDKEILLLDSWNHKIFQLVNGEKRIRYVLDFGKHGFTKKEAEGQTADELQESMAAGNRTAAGGIYKTDDFLIITAAFKDVAKTYFKSLKNKNIYCFNDSEYATLMEYCLLQGVTDDGLVFGLVQPDKMMELQKTSGKYKDLKVTENDNPYVIFFKVSVPKQ